MFQEIDRQEGPLTRVTANEIAGEFPIGVAHILILRRARNLCWIDWHGNNREPYERQTAQLGYKILRKAIDAEITKAIKHITA